MFFENLEPMMPITETVKQLLIINLIFFVGSQFVADAQVYLPMYFFENPMFGFWQPLTSMFMHGGLMHILFNMFGLYMFGSILERFWGAKKFLFFYISCGLGAALVHQGVNYYEFHTAYNILVEKGIPQESIDLVLQDGNIFYVDSVVNSLSMAYKIPVVGASGAIYGILIAFAFMFPNEKLMLMFIPVPIKAKFFIPALLLYDFLSGLNGSSIFGFGGGIAHFAHLGGALTGFLIMWYWKKNSFKRNRWD